MTSNDSNGGPRTVLGGPQRTQRMSLRRKVSLKFKEFQGFVNEYSENVSTGGMFIRTPSPQPEGTVFDFELALGDGHTLIHGIGEVVWTREEDEGFDRPPGMGVRFLNLDPESRKLIDRMVQERLDREASRASASDVPDGEGSWGELPPPLAGGAAPWQEALPEWGEAPPAEPEKRGEARPRETLLFPSERVEAAGAAPRRPTPSPYVYARSYQGSGVASRSRRGRPLLAVLLAIAVVVAALAAFFLFFPETAMRLLVPGAGGDEDRVAEAGPTGPAVAAAEGERPGEPAVRPEAEGGSGPAPASPSAGAAPERSASAAEGTAPGEAGAGEKDHELGFFEPAPTSSPPPAPRPEAQGATGERQVGVPAPVPTPAPPPEPPPPAAPARFSRVLNVVWEDLGDELQVTVFFDGVIQEWEYSTVRLEGPPRELVRIDGVAHPFPRTEIPVGTDLLKRIRVGFHPEGRQRQLHVVLDLATPDAELDRTEAKGTELRLYLARRDG